MCAVLYIKPPPPTPSHLVSQACGRQEGCSIFPSSSLTLITTSMSTHELAEKPELLSEPATHKQPIMGAHASAPHSPVRCYRRQHDCSQTADADWLVWPWVLPKFLLVIDLWGNHDPRKSWECLQPAEEANIRSYSKTSIQRNGCRFLLAIMLLPIVPH